MFAAQIDRIVLVPRWSGTATSDFYPWLRSVVDVPIETVPLLPDPTAPDVAATVAAVHRVLGVESSVLARTLVLGHSVGVQGALRGIAALPEGLGVRAVVCIAGWWSVDRPWPSLLPWQEPFAFDRIRGRTGAVHVVISDDDPFTSDHPATARLFEERLGATVTTVAGGKHFNQPTEPRVVEALDAALGGEAARQATRRAGS